VGATSARATSDDAGVCDDRRVHYHAYSWTGGTDEYRRYLPEGHIDHAGFRASPAVPLKICWWLRKPAAMIAASFTEPADAADWAVEQYRRIADDITVPNLWTEEQHGPAIAHLAAGRDLAWSWHLTGPRRAFACIAVCSPNHWDPEAGCPLR
jgi:hypothetical protein